MSDFLSVITPNTDLTVSDPGGFQGAKQQDTGDLRRKFNFGDQVSELAIAQDPFFRFVSKVGKKPTDDPSFKFTEKRGSWHKRYAFPIAFSNDNSTWVETLDGTDIDTQLDKYETAGSTVWVKMACDYKGSGNIQNIYGNSSNEVTIGSDGTQPKFFMPGQLVKINFGNASASLSAKQKTASYSIIRIDAVTLQDESTSPPTAHTHGEAAILRATVIKTKTAGHDVIAGVNSAAPIGDSTYNVSISGEGETNNAGLEDYKAYVVGTSHEEGSGYPETWKDQPYSTGYGYTQIWKTSMAMTNTARATVLKYEPNEWARVWKDKLIEHKYDIEQSLLFGSQTTRDNIQYTQGAVDFVLGYGNTFSLSTATKTADDFLQDMSSYLDPRYNNANATVFFCNTVTYNWLHKLGGYFSNNLNINSNFSADLAVTGRKKVLGLDTTTINTVYGNMNVVRNIHLDGTNINMLGINMKYAKYRPLVGNGVNRDTSVYVGVQTLENSGVDRRVDLILTEAGMEWSMPEAHAIWTA